MVTFAERGVLWDATVGAFGATSGGPRPTVHVATIPICPYGSYSSAVEWVAERAAARVRPSDSVPKKIATVTATTAKFPQIAMSLIRCSVIPQRGEVGDAVRCVKASYIQLWTDTYQTRQAMATPSPKPRLIIVASRFKADQVVTPLIVQRAKSLAIIEHCETLRAR